MKLLRKCAAALAILSLVFQVTPVFAATAHTWSERQPAGNGGASWSEIATDDTGTNLIAAENSGHEYYVSHDGGATWTNIPDFPSTGQVSNSTFIASDADGSNLIVGGYNQLLYTSDDGGDTWTERQPTGEQLLGTWKVASDDDGSTLLVSYGSYDMYISHDSGVTWEPSVGAAGGFALAMDADGSNLVTGEFGQNLHVSTDGGDSWQPTSLTGNFWTVASDDDGSNLIVTNSTGLYTSDDGGDTWEERQPGGVPLAYAAVSSDADGSHLTAGGYTSDDGGVTWVEEPIGASSAIVVDDDGTNFLAFTAEGRLYTSPDSVGPTVSSFNPADDETSISTVGNLSVVFDEDIATSTGDINIHKASDDSIVETIDIAGPQVTLSDTDTLTIDPSASLEYETEYYILIDAGAIEDVTGNSFAGILDETTWSFTTEPPLAVSSLYPADNAVNVSTTVEGTLTFNQEVTLGTGNITLKRASDDVTVTTIDVTDGGIVELYDTELYFYEEVSLDINTEYYFLVDAGVVEDLVGNPFVGIADETTWSFTTDTPPVTVSFSPEDDATNVSIDFLSSYDVTIQFDQSVNAGTGNITLKKAVDDSTVEIFDVTDDAVVEAGSETVYIYPTTELLEYASEYYFLIDAGAFEDEGGAPFAGIADETTWNFSTEGTPPPNAELDELKNLVSFDGTVNAAVTDGTTLYVGGNFDFAVGGGTTGGGLPFDETTQSAVGTFPEVNGSVSSVVSDEIGGWYIGGSFDSVGGVVRNNIAHIVSDGSVDENFDPDVDAQVSKIVLSPDGQILYALGSFSSVNAGEVSRNTGLAAFDTTTGVANDFDPPSTDGNLHNMLLSEDGATLYITGAFSFADGVSRYRAAAFDTGTSELTEFDPATFGSSGSAMALGDGVVYMGGGGFYSINHHVHTKEFLSDTVTGTKSSLPAVGFGSVNAAVPDGGGGWYVGGNFSSLNSFSITRNNLFHVLQDGTVDPNFDPNLDGLVNTLTLSDDGGTLYAGGGFTSVNGGATARNRVAAFDTETGLATSFDPQISDAPSIYDIALSSDEGTLYVTGSFQTVNGGGVTRYGAAGFDTATGIATAFDPNLGASFTPGHDIEVVGPLVYIGGEFTLVNGDTTRNYIASFDGTTGEVTAFNPNASDGVYKIIVDGSIAYASGSFTTVNGATPRNHVAAFDTTTGVATSFDPDADSIVTEMALVEDGSLLYVGGYFDNVNGDTERGGLAGLDTATGIATDFYSGGTSVSGAVGDIVLDGATLYVGGSFELTEGVARDNLASVDAVTGVVTDFDPDMGGGDIESMVVSQDGETLYAGGNFTTVNTSTTRNSLAAFDTTTGIATAFDPDVSGGYVSALDLSSDGLTLYAGGNFSAVNGDIARGGFAEFDLDTSNVTDFDPALNGDVTALDVAEGLVYIGGYFTATGASTRHNIAAINLSSYTLLPFDPDVAGTVNALELSSDGLTLYAGGSFDCVNGEGGEECSGTTRNRLAAFTTADGVVTAFDPNVAGTVNALKLSSDDSTLYAGGSFQTVNGGTTRRRVAAFTTADGVVTAFNPNINSTVNALELSSDDSVLYAGGSFSCVGEFDDGCGDTPRGRLASFTTTDGVPTAFDPSPDSTVNALKLSDDELTLYAGGSFEEVNGGDFIRNYLAEFTIADSVATDFAPNPDGTVFALDLTSDGSTLYMGGYFTEVDSQERIRIASVNSVTGELSTFSPSVEDIDGYVLALVLAPDQSELYVGGAFTGGLAIYTLIEDETPPAEEEESSGSGSHRRGGGGSSSGGDTLLESLWARVQELRAILASLLGSSSTTYTRDLDLNSEGSDVTALQLFLIAQNKGPQAQALAAVGATGFFGPLTQAALAEFQASVGITPASGYLGPITRAYINGL